MLYKIVEVDTAILRYNRLTGKTWVLIQAANTGAIIWREMEIKPAIKTR